MVVGFQLPCMHGSRSQRASESDPNRSDAAPARSVRFGLEAAMRQRSKARGSRVPEPVIRDKGRYPVINGAVEGHPLKGWPASPAVRLLRPVARQAPGRRRQRARWRRFRLSAAVDATGGKSVFAAGARATPRTGDWGPPTGNRNADTGSYLMRSPEVGSKAKTSPGSMAKRIALPASRGRSLGITMVKVSTPCHAPKTLVPVPSAST